MLHIEDLNKKILKKQLLYLMYLHFWYIALNRKLETDVERNYVKMLWEKCISAKFTKFTLKEKNYMLLCQTQIIY